MISTSMLHNVAKYEQNLLSSNERKFCKFPISLGIVDVKEFASIDEDNMIMLVRNHSVSPPASFVEISVVENSLSCNIVSDVNLPISVGMLPSNALPRHIQEL